MPLKDSDLKSLMLWPSLRGVIYQATTLSAQLERINKEEFPPEACLVKDVFQCLAAYILDELVAIQKPSAPFEMDIDTATRIRSMAGYLRTIHSYIRYLTASSPRQSPPAVQNEIVRQTKRHFPKEYGNPICIVRPQWTYNLKCVPISEELKKLSKSALDPANKLSLKPGETVLSALWDKYLKKLRTEGKEVPTESPNQIGVLSFPSIDTPDTLLLPLLGHELGHFIAFAPPTPYHEDTDLLESAKISEDRVYEIIEEVTGKPAITSEATRYYSILKLQVSICLRELLADRLAARMLGLSFFLAQAKFIKTTTHWNHPLISETGYPNIGLRLSAIFSEITAQQYPGNPLLFLKENSLHHPDITKPLLDYLAAWQQHFANAPVIKHQKSAVIGEELLVEPFYELVESALNETTLEILDRIAKQIIPDSKCARLSSRFFERIVRLSKDLPPSLPGENIDSFAEILSAGWAYQVVIGESRESSVPDNPSTIDEHTKTCNLILKAIELILVQETKTNTQSVSVGPPLTSTRRSGKLSRVLKGFPVIKRLLPAIELSTQFEDRKGDRRH